MDDKTKQTINELIRLRKECLELEDGVKSKIKRLKEQNNLTQLYIRAFQQQILGDYENQGDD